MFVFGYSNGRDAYIDRYLEGIWNNSTVTNTMVFFGSAFLNMKVDQLKGNLSEPARLSGIVDESLISM